VTKARQAVAEWCVRHARPLAWTAWILILILALSPLIESSGTEDATLVSDVVVISAFFVFIFSMSTVGAFVATRRPRNPLPWLMLFGSFWYAFAAFSDTYATLSRHNGAYPGLGVLSFFSSVAWLIGLGVAGTYLLMLFPDGHLRSPRWRPVAWAAGIGIAAFVIGTAIQPGYLEDVPGKIVNPFGIEGAETAGGILSGIGFSLLLFSMLASITSIVLRYRGSTGEIRQQMKWLVFSGAVILVGILASSILEGALGGSETAINFSNAVVTIAISLVPISIGIAVLRYRLYDVDVVINKSLVFGSLAVFITAVYVAIVVGIGTVLGSQDEANIALSIAATAIVAIAFSPVKERTQRVANRLIYGHRLSPYEVLADLSRTAATAPTPSDVIAAVAHAAALGVNAQGATVTLDLNDEQVVMTNPDDFVAESDLASESEEVVHEGDRLGTIAIHKQVGSLTPHDVKVLRDLSKQAGLVFHNARLAFELQTRLDEISQQADELQSSRARIVSAADDSRRRLEEDLTKGPKRELVSIRQDLEQAHAELQKDADLAASRLDAIKAETNSALEALRDLARGIYPPLLADKGIIAAVEAHIRKRDLPVVLETDEATRGARFKESIESTVYFCCIEALNRSDASVRLRIGRAGGMLWIEIDPVTVDDESSLVIHDRVEAIDGSVQYDGRRLKCELPISDGELRVEEAADVKLAGTTS
jgi:signal transduction histidine kinase